MKWLIILCTLGCLSFATADNKLADCKCKEIKLYGKVRVVESYPDFKVRISESYPDLKVKTVNSYPDQCGEWQFVERYPDFTIQFVDSYEDFTIQFVNSYPGVN